jgi:predicted PurR-regulated permease PerM
MKLPEFLQDWNKNVLWILAAVLLVLIWFFITFIKWITIFVVCCVLYYVVVKPFLLWLKDKFKNRGGGKS